MCNIYSLVTLVLAWTGLAAGDRSIYGRDTYAVPSEESGLPSRSTLLEHKRSVATTIYTGKSSSPVIPLETAIHTSVDTMDIEEVKHALSIAFEAQIHPVSSDSEDKRELASALTTLVEDPSALVSIVKDISSPTPEATIGDSEKVSFGSRLAVSNMSVALAIMVIVMTAFAIA